MNRTTADDNVNAKRTLNKQEATYGYENTYSTYYSNSSSPSTNNQPLPGQPPLPPMPPPPGALPPLPHVFSAVPQVAQIQTWTHATPTWQWIAPQATALPTQPARDVMVNNAGRGNFSRRDRFPHNRNNVYSPRGSFHRKNRRPRFDQTHVQFDPSAYFGQSLTGMNIDWQRTGFTTGLNDSHVNHMAIPISNQLPSSGNTERQEGGDADVKIVSEVAIKKTKQRKPMSQNYPSRPWNRDDAQSALKVENEYNKTVRAQSLIIKFPDPDLNKDIVREFHQGIQNIHFQSPSGPRYCFIQMSEDVNIDEAIKELEKIPFGVGHLKVERKSLRDEDYPMPEEIDPYTLYVGNLPESVNVNEVKSKFPTATRVDVGYAQKMRNTRYAFIRYTSVEESIAAYKKAHDLMWDTRSIIVRFRRQRGNTCLPGEPKNNPKKVKNELDDNGVKNERAECNGGQRPRQDGEVKDKTADNHQQSNTTTNQHENNANLEQKSRSPSEHPTVSTSSVETSQQPTQLWTSQSSELPSPTDTLLQPPPSVNDSEETVIITTIKEEPDDYDEMEMPYMRMIGDDDDDDDDDEPDELDASNDEMDDNDIEPDDREHENSLELRMKSKRDEETSCNAPDHLDQMFNALDNIVDEIEF
ncbi:hypothetical protein PV325_005696 [Microctonus aethiopoides]|uniref:RRM domain-containing protein n=1 Tax=Microctonus aethiopoides TaxID=144406 RepID=A0AA39F863_9HYME|nr:hypothetical protein PV325_005696 [Microctonus aethiopoides]KAK0164737.1 hypothetical protein PV328_003324 [Microctonus aethiopoides]